MNLGVRFYYIAFLLAANAADARLTDIGMRQGLMSEANPLMNAVYRHSPLLFLLLKLALPLLLLLLVLRSRTMTRPINALLAGTCVLYAFVLSMHGVWVFDRFNL